MLSGVAGSRDGKPEASMGVDSGAFDNDGDPEPVHDPPAP